MTNGRILSRDDLLSIDHLKRELVPVPELQGSVWMRELSSGDLITFNQRIRQLQRDGITEVTPDISIQLMALIVSKSACDETGKLLFSESDVQGLLVNKIDVLQCLAEKAQALSGLQATLAAGATRGPDASLKKTETDYSFSDSPMS